MRISEQIQDDILEKLGCLPPFFAPALQNPLVLENLWQQTLSAYIIIRLGLYLRKSSPPTSRVTVQFRIA